MRWVLLYEPLECFVTGESGDSIVKRFHALTQTASDCRCATVGDAGCNALSELDGDKNMGEVPFKVIPGITLYAIGSCPRTRVRLSLFVYLHEMHMPVHKWRGECLRACAPSWLVARSPTT